MKAYCTILFLLVLRTRANFEGRKCNRVSIFEDKIVFYDYTDGRTINGLGRLYDKVTARPNTKCPSGVKEIIENTQDHPDKYMVYIGVDDFYKFNYNYVSKYLIYAGDLEKSSYNLSVCYINFKDNSMKHMPCDLKSQSYNEVTLMTTNVAQNPTLYNFIKEYMKNKKGPTITTTKITNDTITNYTYNKIPNVVLVCNIEINERNEIERLKNFDGVIIKYSDDCKNDVKNFQQDLLAVLAPKPFETDYDILVPILLYKPPCYEEKIADVSNYVNITKSCDSYKEALLGLMNKAEWKRVALISDNTPYSEAMEKEITASFEKQGIVYTVERCIETINEGCNFIKALKSLDNADARVHIANVDEDNLQRLYKDVVKLDSKNRFLKSWILRDSLDGYAMMRGNVFTISLAPSMINTDSSILVGTIIEGIGRLHKAYIPIKKQYDNRERRKFFRKLTNDVRDISNRSDVAAYVTKKDKGNEEIIGRIFTNYQPDMDQCTMRSNNFLYPCDESNILKILVILVVVAAGALLITVIHNYFIAPTASRYRNLR